MAWIEPLKNWWTLIILILVEDVDCLFMGTHAIELCIFSVLHSQNVTLTSLENMSFMSSTITYGSNLL